MNKNITFAERTGTSLPIDASKAELFEYASELHKKFEEEVAEMFDALVVKDVIELLDACKDLNVYLDQFIDSLTKVGIDVAGAQEAVALNNELKYTTSRELVTQWYNEHRELGNDYKIFDITIEGTTYYCLKDSNNKVRKPVGHEKVSLIEFIPKHLLEVKQYVWDNSATDFDELMDC